MGNEHGEYQITNMKNEKYKTGVVDMKIKRITKWKWEIRTGKYKQKENKQ